MTAQNTNQRHECQVQRIVRGSESTAQEVLELLLRFEGDSENSRLSCKGIPILQELIAVYPLASELLAQTESQLADQMPVQTGWFDNLMRRMIAHWQLLGRPHTEWTDAKNWIPAL